MQSKNETENEGRKRRGYIPAACVKFIQKLYEKNREPHPNNDKNRPKERSIFIPTCIIAFAGIATLIASLIQACIFNKQLGEMKTTSRIMEGQLNITRIQLRPYVELLEIRFAKNPRFSVTDKQSKWIQFTAVWKNYGSTPAIGMENWIASGFFTDAEAKAFPFSEPNQKLDNRIAITVAPGATITGGHKELSYDDILQASATANEPKVLYLWGEATYQDAIAPIPIHPSHFCIEVGGELPNAPQFTVSKPECNYSK
jgi:hypothetical protein